jgi:hypothetical protein
VLDERTCGMEVLLFVPVWPLNYWQAWIFRAVLSVSVLAIALHAQRYSSDQHTPVALLV